MTKVYYDVPYEAGFKQGTKHFGTLEEATKFAKSSYGDVYKIESTLVVRKDIPVKDKNNETT